MSTHRSISMSKKRARMSYDTPFTTEIKASFFLSFKQENYSPLMLKAVKVFSITRQDTEFQFFSLSIFYNQARHWVSKQILIWIMTEADKQLTALCNSEPEASWKDRHCKNCIKTSFLRHCHSGSLSTGCDQLLFNQIRILFLMLKIYSKNSTHAKL